MKRDSSERTLFPQSERWHRYSQDISRKEMRNASAMLLRNEIKVLQSAFHFSAILSTRIPGLFSAMVS